MVCERRHDAGLDSGSLGSHLQNGSCLGDLCKYLMDYCDMLWKIY